MTTFAAAAGAQEGLPTIPDDPTSGVPVAGPEEAITDPGATCAEQTESVNRESLGCDTKYTPIAKEGSGIGWTQWAGAVHRDAEKPSGYDVTVQSVKHPIPPTVDFYTVSFANPSNGLAGGAQCKEDPPDELLADDLTDQQEADLTQFLNACVRVPVIYRYTDNSEDGPIWKEAHKGTTPGYVGAITWLHNLDTQAHGLRALAVGGDSSTGPDCPKSETIPPYPTEDEPGCGGYPRREPAIPDEVAAACRVEAAKLADVEHYGDPKVDPGNPLLRPTPPGSILPFALDASKPPSVDPGVKVTPHDAQQELAECEDRWRREHDPAGMGRAWLFSDGGWRNLGTAGDGLPARMRGLAALDASLHTDDCPGATRECAMAGGLQQIWIWKDGEFDPIPYEPKIVAERPDRAVHPDPDSPVGWRFRIRQIRFTGSSSKPPTAITAGCCTSHPNPDMANPRVLTYSPNGFRWSLDGSLLLHTTTTCNRSYPVCGRRYLPDSLYAFTSDSFLASPGGPERGEEPPSQIVLKPDFNARYQFQRDLLAPHGPAFPAGVPRDVLAHWATPARLVAGDGDFQGHQVSLRERATAMDSRIRDADGYMDWAVGGFKQSQRGLGYTTTTQTYSPANLDGPFPLDCPAGLFDGSGAAGDPTSAQQCTPDDKAADQTKSGYLFRLSSYFLNGFTFAGASGVGWGVGDRGAIERLAGNAAAAGGTLREEAAPNLGAKRPAPAPPREPYRSTESELSDDVGAVPPLGALAPRQLSEPTITPYGSPNPHGEGETVNKIVMARDGSEGWGVGPRMTLYRFDGTRWRRCPTDSVEGAIEADPACEALWPLRHDTSPWTPSAIARIPMEYGDDPTKADEFEAIAVAQSGGGDPKTQILRYQDGRWALDRTPMLDKTGNPVSSPGVVTDLAFSSPDDGWLLTQDLSIWRFDGERWARCWRQSPGVNEPFFKDMDTCADHNRLFPEIDGPTLVPRQDADDDLGWSGPPHLTSAGDRLYLYGHRQASKNTGSDQRPMILYRNPGPCQGKGDSGCWQQAYDPGCAGQRQNSANGAVNCVPDPDPSKAGLLTALSVALGPDGTYNGWGFGNFGNDELIRSGDKGRNETPFIHSKADGTSWAPMTQLGDAASDYLLSRKWTHFGPSPSAAAGRIVALPGPGARGMVIADRLVGPGPPVWLDPETGKWGLVPLPGGHIFHKQAEVAAIAPDNGGGAWFVDVPGSGTQNESLFYRFSSQWRPEVFEEAAHPIRERITAAAGGGDGSFWVATSGNVLHRYDRLTGWDRITIPGWDPGRVVTRPSEANAIAIGADGNGVVVGRFGRIAEIGPGGAVLDVAAGTLCSKAPPPCGTGRDLRAASVAPDGSAMVGGDNRALLYRYRGTGDFQAITPPPTAIFATITGISLPSAHQAWLTTASGEIWEGTGPGEWTWEREDTDEFGDSLSRDERRRQQPLRAIAIDAAGHGYAVGERGAILERTGEGPTPWRRINSEYLDHFRSVTLGPNGKGALIAGDTGLLLTLSGRTLSGRRFEPARFADRFTPTDQPTSRVVGLALLPGYEDGQVEAWAASQVPFDDVGAMLHYSSDPSEPLLDGAPALPTPVDDAPQPASEAISFAAFGNSNCLYGSPRYPDPCPELSGSNASNDLAARRIRDQILPGESTPGRADFALFTGDVGDVAGMRPISGNPNTSGTFTPLDDSPIHDRWRELIAEPLIDAGVPLFGTVGGRDLSEFSSYHGIRGSASTRQARAGGPNLRWRQAMAGMPAPWGAPGAPSARSEHGLSFEPVDTGGGNCEPGSTRCEPGDTTLEDPSEDALGGKTIEDPTKAAAGTTIPNPTGGGDHTVPESGEVGDRKIPESGLVGDQKLPTGGARTHYALDVVRDGKPLLRLVVLDTSLRSLAASDAQQNPIEEQLGWLRDALQRPPGERAVVLTNTPTYSYGPGALTDTVAEGTALESILMQNRVDLVVDGRLGWNALYWALAPGVHWPCPGDPYPSAPPQGVPACQGVGSSELDQAVTNAQQQAAELNGDVGAAGALPFLVAHSAGGKFGPDGQALGSATNGFWRGYSIVHLDPETGAVQIEQRPVFDWIGIRVPPGAKTKATHVLRPNQKLDLEGFGREVLGIDAPARYDEISTAAITHRFELLEADPAKPWLPKEDQGSSDNETEHRSAFSAQIGEEDPCGPYLCLDAKVGGIDHQSGMVRAGTGAQARTFAIAQLSVGEENATYPLMFEPRSSFRAPAPVPPRPSLPPPPTAPNQPPPQNTPTVEPPQPPTIPPVEQPLSINPVIPPTPPAYGNASPIDLGIAPVAIVAPPPTVVLQPPNPVVQPAPPSGARREARQRQAATQKSGMESGLPEEAPEVTEGGGDTAVDRPGSSAMNRHESAASRLDPGRPPASFTPLARSDQPSAWARDALIGGGLGIAALVLALGLSGARPTPRRRQPEAPAPAWSRQRR